MSVPFGGPVVRMPGQQLCHLRGEMPGRHGDIGMSLGMEVGDMAGLVDVRNPCGFQVDLQHFGRTTPPGPGPHLLPRQFADQVIAEIRRVSPNGSLPENCVSSPLKPGEYGGFCSRTRGPCVLTHALL